MKKIKWQKPELVFIGSVDLSEGCASCYTGIGVGEPEPPKQCKFGDGAKHCKFGNMER